MVPTSLRDASGVLVLMSLGVVVHGDDGSTGPSVGDGFSAAAFDAAGQPESIFVAWRDETPLVHSGLLRLDDGSFDAFPVQTPPRGVTNLHVGVGGPGNARRAYVAWVDNTLDLVVVVFDENGSVVAPPQVVANAVQVAPIRFSYSPTARSSP